MAHAGALKPDADAPGDAAAITPSFVWISHYGFGGSVGLAMAATACVLASRGLVSEEHAPFLRFQGTSPPPAGSKVGVQSGPFGFKPWSRRS